MTVAKILGCFEEAHFIPKEGLQDFLDFDLVKLGV
jgi:hypothetical protein